MYAKISNGLVAKRNGIVADEEKRLAALRSYHILDSINEHEFDRLAELAALICEVPIAIISLVDETRQWFKSTVGFEIKQTTRDISFCQHALSNDALLEVEDVTKDERFRHNPFVTEFPNIRFYAGYPLIDPNGFALGALCVLDRKPNKLNAKQRTALTTLAQEVISHIVSRKEINEKLNYEKLFTHSIDLVCLAGVDGFFKEINPAFTQVLGWDEKELLKNKLITFVHQADVEKTLAEIEKLSQGVKTINFINRFRTKSGVYKTLDWVANPDTSTGSIYAIARDVTEKLQFKEWLSIAETKFKALFEYSPDAIFVEDSAGTILDINEAAIAIQGLPKDKLIGTNIRMLVPGEKYLKIIKDYKQLYLGVVKTVESSIWSPELGEIPVEISGKRISYENKSALLLHVRDITERRKMETERQQIIREISNRKEEMIQHSLTIQEEERKRIASEMHDEIGAGLSKISVLSHVIKKSFQNTGLVSSNIDKVLKASNELQQNIGEIIWAMDVKNDTLENLLAFINTYASEFFDESGINFQIITPEKIPVVSIAGKIRRNTFLSIKESLNNIAKHANARNARIEVCIQKKILTFIITDDGIGFDTANIARFRNGICNLRQRIADICGALSLVSKPNEGTIVEFSIPMDDSSEMMLDLAQF